MPSWRVKLAVSGAITIAENLTLSVEKQTNYSSFMTAVAIKRATHGVEIHLDALATNREEANEVAIYFVGQTLDVLGLYLDEPLYLSFSGTGFRAVDTNAKRIVLEQEWEDAFKRSRDYGQKRLFFSRALSWYRKGLTSDDLIDKLFAFWVSLEIIGNKFHTKTPKTKGDGKSKNRVLNCFDQIWGSSETWKVVTNDTKWIDDIHELRNKVVHGGMTVEPETIKLIAQRISRLQALASKFLLDWESHGSDLFGENT